MLDKKLNFSFIILTFSLIFTLSSCTESGANKDKSEVKLATKNDIPNLSLTTIDGEEISFKEDFQGKTMLVLFQPDCEDCQREVQQIKDNIEAFKDYKLYFVSSANTSQITAFAEHYQLNDNEKIVFAHTTVQDVIQNLGQVPAPSVYIYSEEGLLIKSFNGEVGVDQIKAYL